MLKEADLRIGFTNLFKSPTSHEILPRETLQIRLLLCLYGLGTNAGMKRVASGAQITYRDLLYVLGRFVNKDGLRASITEIANAVLRERNTAIWGLLPRLKAIGKQRLYRPEVGNPHAYSNLQPILSRPINWELIRQYYDEIVKYATALKLGTGDTEALMSRVSKNKNGVKSPVFQAVMELGKVRKTIFLCEYLNSEALRQEIEEGLNVIENWNSAISFIWYGKRRGNRGK